MRPLVQHISRSSTGFLSSFAAVTRTPFSNPQRWRSSPVCIQCQLRALSTHRSTRPTQLTSNRNTRNITSQARAFRTSSRCLVESQKKPEDGLEKEEEQSIKGKEPEQPNAEPIPLQAPSPNPEVPDEALPSSREKQRWDSSKRVSELMEELQEKIAIATQKVNNYTGTDYSGIQALRQDILEQEQAVKTRRAAIIDAKTALDVAYAQKTSSQKEVVGLLERKHSWSDSDLERYMSLVRSEHLNDQAVQNAKDKVAEAEKGLEEARSRLEKVERKQYHEEQIWSDTIRRNSTWVTFGLMGFNIFVLLASIVLIEPWRRSRMVREIRSALEEHKPIVAPTSQSMVVSPVEAEVDVAIAPVGVTLETLAPTETPDSGAVPIVASKATSIDPEFPPATTVSEAETIPFVPELPRELRAAAPLAFEQPQGRWNELKVTFLDLFSDRSVVTKQIDITTYALQGFAAGATMVGFIAVLLRSR